MSATAFDTGRAPAPDIARYDRFQRSLHWIIAVLMVAAVGLVLYASALEEEDPLGGTLMALHKSVGMTVLILAVVRLLYRFVAPPPPYAQPLGRLNHLAAGTVHVLLYALLLYMPISGYLLSGAGGYSLGWFWLFDWPRLVPEDQALSRLGRGLHGLGEWAVYGIVALHVAGALWHRFVKHDGVMERMLPPR